MLPNMKSVHPDVHAPLTLKEDIPPVFTGCSDIVVQMYFNACLLG